MASTSSTVRVDGLRRLRRDLKAAGDDLSDLKDVHQSVGELVLDAARPRAPRGPTGRLVNSGRASRAAGKVSILFGGARVPYAGPIHWGWPRRGIEAQPFAAEAAAETEPAWLALYSDGIDRVLDGALERLY